MPPGVGYEDGESSYFDNSGLEGSFVQDSFNDDGDRSLSEKDFWLKSGGVEEVKTHIRETSAVIFISSDSIEVGGSELGIFIENKVKSKLLKVSSCGARFVKKSLWLSVSDPLVRVNKLVGYSSTKAHSLGSVQNPAEIPMPKSFNLVDLVIKRYVQGSLKKKGVSFADDPKEDVSSL